MKVLLISFYFPPYPGVGAKRLAYWANAFIDTEIPCEVISSTKPDGNSKAKVIHVPQNSKGKFLAKLIKDPGLKWLEDLKSYFAKLNPDEFDYTHVLISGGPFMQFGIAKVLKSKFKCKIILDYRDPFANNPRFNDSGLKKGLKLKYEKSFAKNADLIITVNPFCAELIETEGKQIEILENGYDETSISVNHEEVNNSTFLLTHAGSLYADRNPTNLMEVLKEDYSNDIQFVQYGSESDYLTPYKNEKYYAYKGMMDYSELMQKMNDSDACVLVTKGDPFESTTKVFDYIALNKRFLIITSGEVKSGNLNEITKNYPNVIWSKNEKSEIAKSLKVLMEMDTKEFDPYPYSRAASFEKLKSILEKL